MTGQFYPYSDPDRIKAMVNALAAMTERDRPFTRLVFSAEYKEARAWLQTQFEEVGLECQIDAGGNLIGTRKAANSAEPPRKLIIGSHIDTVAAGGRFDGIAGVIAGWRPFTSLTSKQFIFPLILKSLIFSGRS